MKQSFNSWVHKISIITVLYLSAVILLLGLAATFILLAWVLSNLLNALKREQTDCGDTFTITPMDHLEGFPNPYTLLNAPNHKSDRLQGVWSNISAVWHETM